MTEAFLHYIWQYRLFDMNNLTSDDNSQVEVVRPGVYNTGAGPDFFNSQIRLSGTLWAGNVEIHIHSSDWQKHNHHYDEAYDSCILHVVFENDASTLRINGSRIPTIQLKNRFQSYLWENYLALIGTQSWISCQPRIREIDDSTLGTTFQQMIEERLEQKKNQIFFSLKANKDDWEETFYQHLSRNFGFQLNAMPFEMLARSLPLKLLRKEKNELINIESLLFGQAGMLSGTHDEEYPLQLAEKYNHYSKRYLLNNIPFSSWKFMRLRPVNFPSVRIAQLAVLLFETPSLFSSIIEDSGLDQIQKIFRVTASPYWNTHYHFQKSSAEKIKRLGQASIGNILINTCVPFIYSWGKFRGNKEALERAFSFLENIPSEENHVISKWESIGIKSSSAFQSQSLIQLKQAHCSEKKCLTCRIGAKLINVLP